MNHLLVTGGAGYIGSHFCAELDRLNVPYTVIDDLSRGRAAFARATRLVVEDIGNGEAVERLLRERSIDCVVHFAAYAYVGESVEQPATYYANNVVKSFALLEAARRAKVRAFVFSSSCTTYGEVGDRLITESDVQQPTNPYGDTKVAVERMLANYATAYGLRFAILRYFNAAGAHPTVPLYEAHDPETHLIPLAIRAAQPGDAVLRVFGDDYPTPDGTCVRDYIHVCDLAAAHVAALRYLEREPSLVCNLGLGRGYSVLDVIAAVERHSGRKVRSSVAPRRAGDPASLVADASKARRELGWAPARDSLDAIVATAWAGEERHVRAGVELG